jgi:hypothetical protein
MAWGQRGHGSLGYAEYVSELLGNNDELLSSLTPVLTGALGVGRNHRCLCGSGMKYKVCCLNRVEDIRMRVGVSTLRSALGGREGP